MTKTFPTEIAICRNDGGGGNRTRVSCPTETYDLQDLSALENALRRVAIEREDVLPIMLVNAKDLGETVIRSVCGSAQAGHTSPLFTLRDYFHAEDPTSLFLRAFVDDSTDDLNAKWFHGQAGRIGAYVLQKKVAP